MGVCNNMNRKEVNSQQFFCEEKAFNTQADDFISLDTLFDILSPCFINENILI